jgi:transposase
MRHRHAISDEDWDRIKDLLPGQPSQHGKVAKDNRLFIDAVLWIAKTGAPWRDLPERFGNWNSAWRRFDRWSKKGVWRRVFDALQDPDWEWVILDSTIVRAHPDAAGAPKKVTAAAAKPSRRWGGAGAGLRPRSTSPSMAWATRSSSS